MITEVHCRTKRKTNTEGQRHQQVLVALPRYLPSRSHFWQIFRALPVHDEY